MYIQYYDGGGAFKKGAQKVGAGARKMGERLNRVGERLNQGLVALGGGTRKVAEARGAKSLEKNRNSIAEAKKAVGESNMAVENATKDVEAARASGKQARKDVQQIKRSNGSTDALNAANEDRLLAHQLYDEARKKAVGATTKLSADQQALRQAKQNLNNQALKLVRNRGLKRLGMAGLLGAAGAGLYHTLTSPSDSQEDQSQYRWTPENGWQHLDDQGNYVDQTKEYGVDRFNNINYYDGTNWVSDYKQGSDGTIYDNSGQVIGSAIDPKDLAASGYSNIFDYNTAQAGIDPNQVVAVQQALQKLGYNIGNVDGKFGGRTAAALQDALKDHQDIFSTYRSS